MSKCLFGFKVYYFIMSLIYLVTLTNVALQPILCINLVRTAWEFFSSLQLYCTLNELYYFMLTIKWCQSGYSDYIGTEMRLSLTLPYPLPGGEWCSYFTYFVWFVPPHSSTLRVFPVLYPAHLLGGNIISHSSDNVLRPVVAMWAGAPCATI